MNIRVLCLTERCDRIPELATLPDEEVTESVIFQFIDTAVTHRYPTSAHPMRMFVIVCVCPRSKRKTA